MKWMGWGYKGRGFLRRGLYESVTKNERGAIVRDWPGAALCGLVVDLVWV